jgi:hypothetical protein
MISPEDTKLLQKLGQRFTSTLNHDAWQSWRTIAQKCYDYRDGHQWTAAELKVLKNRKQPPYVNNQIKLFVDYMLGQYVTTRIRSTYVGKNTPDDDLSSQTMTAVKLNIEQNSLYEFQERDLVEDGILTGFGCLDVRPGINPETGKIEIYINHIDCFEMFPDPYSRKYDWNKDAQFISQAKWVDLEDVIAKWPSKKIALQQLVVGGTSNTTDAATSAGNDIHSDVWGRDTANYIDKERKRLRLIEQQWKEVKTARYMQMPDGEQAEVTGAAESLLNKFIKGNPGAKLFTEKKKTLHVAFFAKDVILEHTIDPYRGSNRYTWIPYFIHRQKNGEPFSFVSTVLPMQDAINKRGSKAMHLLNKDRVLSEKNTIEDKDKFAEEWAKPDGLPEVGDLTKIEVDKNIDLAATQMQFQGADIISMRQIARMNPDSLGEKTPLRSGAGVKAKQRPTTVMLSPDFDNLRRTNVLLGKSILDYVPRYYTGPQVIRITDDPTMGEFASQQFFLNQEDPRTGRTVDVTRYAYDVVMKVVPNFDTVHEVEYQTLAQNIPQLVNLPPAFAVMLIQASNFKNKEELIKTFTQMYQNQPQEKPKISMSMKWEELNEEDRNFFRTLIGSQPQQNIDIQGAIGGQQP